jgi:hypothetical protein
MNLIERFLGWLNAVPEDPRQRETRLINVAIWCGFAVGAILRSLVAEDFRSVAFGAAIAIYTGYRVKVLSRFGYRFGKGSIAARSGRSARTS